jgi:beta-lactamase regulating signal transducer with metallopeptidase domain
MHELLTMMSGWLVSYLTHSAVTLAVLGAMAWLGDRLLRKLGPLAQHRMWVAALLAGVALPLLPAGVLSRFFGHADASVANGTTTATYRIVAAATQWWAVSAFVLRMVAAAYLLVVLFCVTRLLWRWWRAQAMARRSAVLSLDASAGRLLEGVSRYFDVATPEARCSAETRGPVVLGVRRAVLLVPESFFRTGSDEDGWIESDEDIAAALAHECAHIVRRDFTKSLFYEFVAAVVAYHPACWLIRRRVAETRELVCDEMAAAAVGDRPEYAASLLRLATAMTARAGFIGGTQAIGVFDAGILEERVMRLTMDMPKVSRTQRIAMAIVATCALLGGAVTAAALSLDVTPANNAAPLHQKIYKIGGDVSAPVLVYSVDAEFTEKLNEQNMRVYRLFRASLIQVGCHSKSTPFRG